MIQLKKIPLYFDTKTCGFTIEILNFENFIKDVGLGLFKMRK